MTPIQVHRILEELRDFANVSPIVFVLRGLPGSGKSSLASDIAMECSRFDLAVGVCCPDQWIAQAGPYRWDEVAHATDRAREDFMAHLRDQTRVIVVDDTNLQTDEYKFYVEEAEGNFYDSYIVEFHVATRQEAIDVARRSIHLHDVERYDPWARWQGFVSDPRALVCQPRGMRGD